VLHGPKSSVKRARELRKAMSLPEILLWRELRKRPSGLKFRKQHPAGPYAADFFCHGRRLVIEVDGEAHDRSDRPERDGIRDGWFGERRFDVMRIPAREVLRDIDGVVRGIVARALADNPPLKRQGDGPKAGGGTSASAHDTTLVANPQMLTPLHHLPAAGGPPPPLGEEL
jgi:very-short-patch-repair endonuclease